MIRKSRAIDAVKRFAHDVFVMRPDVYLWLAGLTMLVVLTVGLIGFYHGDLTEPEAENLMEAAGRMFLVIVAIPVIVAVLLGMVRWVSRLIGRPIMQGTYYVRRSEHERMMDEMRQEIKAELRSELAAETDGGTDE